jgi:MYXO-CTERM domain-containing protein
MNTSLKKTVAAIALLGVFGFAHADAVIGQNDAYSFGSLSFSKGVSVGDPDVGFSGSFSNLFSFSLPVTKNVEGLFAGIDGSVTGDMQASFKFGVGAAGSPVWAFSTPLSVVPQDALGNFSISALVPTLAAGSTYWIEISGSASQATYTLTLTPTAPVPEPDPWAMLLSGFGLLGAIARRRKIALI